MITEALNHWGGQSKRLVPRPYNHADGGEELR